MSPGDCHHPHSPCLPAPDLPHPLLHLQGLGISAVVWFYPHPPKRDKRVKAGWWFFNAAISFSCTCCSPSQILQKQQQQDGGCGKSRSQGVTQAEFGFLHLPSRSPGLAGTGVLALQLQEPQFPLNRSMTSTLVCCKDWVRKCLPGWLFFSFLLYFNHCCHSSYYETDVLPTALRRLLLLPFLMCMHAFHISKQFSNLLLHWKLTLPLSVVLFPRPHSQRGKLAQSGKEGSGKGTSKSRNQ